MNGMTAVRRALEDYDRARNAAKSRRVRSCAPKARDAYVVLCHRIDCGDDEVFMLDGAWWWSLSEAKYAMERDYGRMCEEWDVGRGGEYVDRGETEITLVVPCTNEDGEDDTLECRWKVVAV